MRSIAAGIVVALIAAIVGGLVYYRREVPPTAAELTELALHAPSVDEQTKAAILLSNYGSEGVAGLRRVADESKEQAVQAVGIEGLAKQWDYDSMERFLNLAEKGAPQARGRAAQVVMQMTGRFRPYDASASAADRRILVKHMREDWKEIQNASAEDRAELIRRLRESDERMYK